jgi:preprotein translocase subunit SecA
VEGHNFSIRKQLIDYDDVMNQQREIIYRQRHEALRGENLKSNIFDMIEDLLDAIVEESTGEKTYAEDWNLEQINKELTRIFGIQKNFTAESLEDVDRDQFREDLLNLVRERYESREKEFGEPLMRDLENYILLQTVDTFWKDHLLNMDYLKEGIGLRGYGQQDPLVAYKREGHEMFQQMIDRIKDEAVRMLYHIQIDREEQVQEMRKEQEDQPMYFGPPEGAAKTQAVRKDGKVGRNDPCPCGSGKKYKKCHGK